MTWLLVKKDLLRLSKHPVGFLLLLAAPIFMASLMGFVFGGDGDNGMTPHVDLVIEDHDDTFVSGFIKSAFRHGKMAEMFNVSEVDSGKGRALVENDKVSALLIIPKGFSDSLWQKKTTELTLVKNPSQAFAPKIAEETVKILAEGGDRLLRIADRPISAIRAEIADTNSPSDESVAAIAVMINAMMQKSADLIFTPPIKMKEKTISTDEQIYDAGTLFSFFLTGVAVMFLYFILNGMAADYFRERDHFTMRRIIVSPAGKARYYFSKHIYLFLAGLASFVLVWIFGFIVWGVRMPLQLASPFLLLCVLIAFSAAGVISFLYSFFRTRNQAAAVTPAVILLLSMLGGGMIPVDSLPNFIKSLTIYSPVYWGVDGLQQIIINHESWHELTLHFGVLTGIALVATAASFFVQGRKASL